MQPIVAFLIQPSDTLPDPRGSADLCAGLVCTAIALLEFFQSYRFRPLRAGMFSSLGMWGIVPVLHSWRLNADVPQVLRALQLDALMGAIYLVRLEPSLGCSLIGPRLGVSSQPNGGQQASRSDKQGHLQLSSS